MNTYVITFDSTTAAMGANKALKAAGFHHAVIPVPTAISAGCGMAVRFSAESPALAASALDEAQLDAASRTLWQRLSADDYQMLEW